MKMALESRLGQEVSAESNIVTFMADYAAYLINRLEVGKEGKTADEQLNGKGASVFVIGVGRKSAMAQEGGPKTE